MSTKMTPATTTTSITFGDSLTYSRKTYPAGTRVWAIATKRGFVKIRVAGTTYHTEVSSNAITAA